jgi:hypothetical protein
MTQQTRPRAWTCTTCRGEFHHRPTIHVGVVFCCAGCVAGGPCTCPYDDEPELVAAHEPPATRELALVD